MPKRGSPNKYCHDKNVRFKPKLVQIQWMLEVITPLNWSWHTADEMATACHNKLQPREVGHICTIKAQVLTVITVTYSALNTVSLQQIAATFGSKFQNQPPEPGQYPQLHTIQTTLKTIYLQSSQAKHVLHRWKRQVSYAVKDVVGLNSNYQRRHIYFQIVQILTWKWYARTSQKYSLPSHYKVSLIGKLQTCWCKDQY